MALDDARRAESGEGGHDTRSPPLSAPYHPDGSGAHPHGSERHRPRHVVLGIPERIVTMRVGLEEHQPATVVDHEIEPLQDIVAEQTKR